MPINKIELTEEQIEARGILKDFLRDFDMERLIGEFFRRGFSAKIFGRFKANQCLSLEFEDKKYHYYMERTPIGYKSPAEIKQMVMNKEALLASLLANKQHQTGKPPSAEELRSMAKRGLLDI